MILECWAACSGLAFSITWLGVTALLEKTRTDSPNPVDFDKSFNKSVLANQFASQLGQCSIHYGYMNFSFTACIFGIKRTCNM